MKKTIFTILFSLSFIGVAFCDDMTVTQEIFSNIFLNYLMPIIYAGTALLISYAMAKLSKLIGIKIPEIVEDKILKIATDAIYEVEEIAMQRIKNNDDIKLTSNEKLDLAINKILNRIPELDVDTAKEYIEKAIAIAPDIGAFIREEIYE